MSHIKSLLIGGVIIIFGVLVYMVLPAYREYTEMVMTPDVTNNASPYHGVAHNATTMDRMISQLCGIIGWDRVVIFSPYQDGKSFRAAGITHSTLSRKLTSLSGIRENWHLVAVDEDENVIDAQIVGWEFVPDANKGIIIVDRSDCERSSPTASANGC